ncbi:MAG: substrate-binding domain-containing protein [Verrucomicrobiota bacterium]
MKTSLVLSILGFSLLALSGCGDKSGSAETPKQPRIAVVPKAGDVEFWKMVQGGVMKAASEEPEYEIIWQPPAIANDRSEQIKTIQNLTIKDVDALAVAPIDAIDMVKSVSNAKKKGIKTIVWDSGLEDDTVYESFVATDNYNGGAECAKALAKFLDGKGNVGLLRYVEGSASTENREQGFLDTIKTFPDIVIISDSQRGGDEAKSQEVGSRLLQKDGDELHAIFCSNQTTTEGMLRAMEKSPLQGQIVIVGFDFNPYIAESLRNGNLSATAAQDPFNMGYLSVKTSIDLLEGKTPDKLVDTGVYIVTKENIDDTDMQNVLFPDYQSWLKDEG